MKEWYIYLGNTDKDYFIAHEKYHMKPGERKVAGPFTWEEAIEWDTNQLSTL